MLVLTRRIGESLKIGEEGDIEVTVLGVKGSQTRLGISAPKEITVHRDEIYQKIQAEKASLDKSQIESQNHQG